MPDTRQLALPLELPAASSLESFVVGHSNVEAWDFLTQRPIWPTQNLCLFGPASCGKTHLGVIWAQRYGARWTGADELFSDTPSRTAERLVIDTGSVFSGTPSLKTCEALFHILTAQEAFGGATLLILRCEPPSDILPDLVSRLRAMTRIAIMEPDDSVLEGMLEKLLDDLGASVHPDAAVTAARLMTRSGADALRLAHELNEASLATGRRITPPLVRKVLSAV